MLHHVALVATARLTVVVVVLVHLKGEERLLKPMLVTGLKMWHLRPESVFFPKNNFYNVVSTSTDSVCCVRGVRACVFNRVVRIGVVTVPPHSDVVFLFGEIDCREGLVVSVEKCRYRDLEEGAQVPCTSHHPPPA
jgi:hypothetical protein